MNSRDVQQLTITLPTRVVQAMRAKVSAGEYGSEGEIIEEALLTAVLPATCGSELEGWIATEGVRVYDAMRADPSRRLTPEEVSASLGIEPER